MIWELAGIAGMDPDPYTLAQLERLARGRQRSEWAQTSMMLCTFANAHRDRRLRPYPFTPDDFDPFAEYRPRGLPFNKETSRILAQAITGQRLPPDRPSRWDMLTGSANPGR